MNFLIYGELFISSSLFTSYSLSPNKKKYIHIIPRHHCKFYITKLLRGLISEIIYNIFSQWREVIEKHYLRSCKLRYQHMSCTKKSLYFFQVFVSDDNINELLEEIRWCPLQNLQGGCQKEILKWLESTGKKYDLFSMGLKKWNSCRLSA